MISQQEELMRQAIALALRNVDSGQGGPFGAIIVKKGIVVATGVNLVTSTNDPTAHAEVVAIREACKALGSFQLDECEIFSSCEPCPMCLGAIYWARLNTLYFSSSRQDAALAHFDDAFIYDELGLTPPNRSIPGHQLLPLEGKRPFDAWAATQNKLSY